jgi:hypothetical protein
MTSTLQEVVLELRELLTAIDEAAVAAKHAQADAAEANASYLEAGKGTDHPVMNQAVAKAEAAVDKAFNTAELLAAAADAFADYINTIAPGTVPARYSAPDAMPDGERLLSESEERDSRSDVAWRKQTKKADDTNDAGENVESGARSFFKDKKNLERPSGVTVASTAKAVAKQKSDSPEIDNPITALAMGVAAVATAVKGLVNYHKKRQENQRKEPRK